jgi:hypothetical protein
VSKNVKVHGLFQFFDNNVGVAIALQSFLHLHGKDVYYVIILCSRTTHPFHVLFQTVFLLLFPGRGGGNFPGTKLEQYTQKIKFVSKICF